MKVFASPFVPNSPETPKSQSLTWPLRQRRILEGLMSAKIVSWLQRREETERVALVKG